MLVAKEQILDHKRRWDGMGYGKKRTIILIDLAKTELRKPFTESHKCVSFASSFLFAHNQKNS